jgi:hypothetical protein
MRQEQELPLRQRVGSLQGSPPAWQTDVSFLGLMLLDHTCFHPAIASVEVVCMHIPVRSCTQVVLAAYWGSSIIDPDTCCVCIASLVRDGEGTLGSPLLHSL